MKPNTILAVMLAFLSGCEPTGEAEQKRSATASNLDHNVEVKTLRNLAVEDDKARVLLSLAENDKDNTQSEDEKIEALILSLKQLVGAKFIRNGQEYTLYEAVDHMRKKWEWKKAEIKTADDFIRLAGSKSSISGEPYLIRLPDGTEMKAEEWLRMRSTGHTYFAVSAGTRREPPSVSTLISLMGQRAAIVSDCPEQSMRPNMPRRVSGVHVAFDGREVAWACETVDARKISLITVNGVEYPFKDGNTILISSKGSQVRVFQMQLEDNKIVSLENLCKANSAASEFFSKSAAEDLQ